MRTAQLKLSSEKVLPKGETRMVQMTIRMEMVSDQLMENIAAVGTMQKLGLMRVWQSQARTTEQLMAPQEPARGCRSVLTSVQKETNRNE